MRTFDRRRFLVGLGGATMALPFLEGLAPKLAKAAGPNPYLFVFSHNNGVSQGGGRHLEQFWPLAEPTAAGTTVTEADLRASLAGGRATGELAGVAQHMNFLRGVDHLDNGKNSPRGQVEHHENGGAQVLTGSGCGWRGGDRSNHNNVIPLSEGFVQRVAREFAVDALYLQGSGAGYGVFGPYIHNRDSLDRNAFLAYQESDYRPLNLYARLFAITRPQELLDSRRSVNDLVKDDLKRVRANPRLSRADIIRLDAHLDAVRSAESMVANCGAPPESSDLMRYVRSSADRNVGRGNPEYFERYSARGFHQQNEDAMIALAVLGVACGSARVVHLFSKAGEGTQNTDMYAPGSPEYENGAPLPMHDYSHSLDGPGEPSKTYQSRLFASNKWTMRRVAKIVQGLKDAGVLDSGLVIAQSEQADGDHLQHNVPFITAGNCGGRLKTGQVVAANCYNNRVLATFGAALGLKDNGAPITNFGGLREGGQREPGGYVDALKSSTLAT